MTTKPHVVALDAQALREGNWPDSNAKLKKLAEQCKVLGIHFWIIEGGRDEVRAAFERALRKSVAELETAASRVRDLGLEVTLTHSPESDTLEAWDGRSQSAAGALSAYISPTSNRGSIGYFKMSVNRTAPFDEKGAGFRDAVIFASLVDEMKRMGLSEAFLVSRDRDFNAVVPDVEGIRIRPSDIDRATVLLEEVLGELKVQYFNEVMAFEKARREEVETAVLQARDQIDSFLAEHLAIAAGDLDGLEGLLVRPLEFRLLTARGLTTSPAYEDVQTGSTVDVSMTAEISGQFEIQIFERAPFRLKLGESAADLSSWPVSPEIRVQTISFPVSLNLRLTRTESGYANVAPVSVQPIPLPMRALRKAILEKLAE